MDFLEGGTSSANLVTLKLLGGLQINDQPNCPCAMEWSPYPLIQNQRIGRLRHAPANVALGPSPSTISLADTPALGALAGLPTRPDEPQPPMQQNSKIRLLTEQDVRNIEPVRHARKITVGRCLYLNVIPTGGRSWYYKFYFEGKCQKLMLGTYPEISLECAKSRHQYARNLIAQGINPCEMKATLGKNGFVRRMRDWETARHQRLEHSLAGTMAGI